MTVQVRWGALPPVSQQKTISPGTQGFVWTCPIWNGTTVMIFISPVARFILAKPLGPAPIPRGPKDFSSATPGC